MGLPQSAAARALCDFGIPWDFPKTLALGSRAMLGLVGTAGKRWPWSPVHFGTRWDSLGLVGTRAMFIPAMFFWIVLHIWD